MGMRIDDNDEIIVGQQAVTQRQTEIQKEDQKTQKVAKPVIATLSEEKPKTEALFPVTTIDPTPSDSLLLKIADSCAKIADSCAKIADSYAKLEDICSQIENEDDC